MTGYVLDDSDSQWAERERLRVVVSRVSRPYWLAIPADERERIVAAIPDDTRLHIRPGYRAKPGTADVGLRTLDNREAGQQVRGRLDARLCWCALPRVVVTTDGDGWVQSIEEVA